MRNPELVRSIDRHQGQAAQEKAGLAGGGGLGGGGLGGDGRLRQEVLRFLAGLALEADPAKAAAGLAQLPVGVVTDLIAELTSGSWSEPDRWRLVSVLRRDGRPAVRQLVARAVGALVRSMAAEEAAEALFSMADDQSEQVRDEVAWALAVWLAEADGMTQIAALERWVCSPLRLTRETLARALCRAFPCPVAELALELLAGDPVPAVRLEAVNAICARFDEDPEGYGELLGQIHRTDPRGPVRRWARRGLRRLASARPWLIEERPDFLPAASPAAA